MEEELKKEKKEVYEYGVKTPGVLKECRETLDKNLFSGFFLKRKENIHKAEAFMEQSKLDLILFARMVDDINKKIYLRFDEEDFLAHANSLFEGYVKDWLKEERIDECKDSLDHAIYYLEVVLHELR